MHRDIHWKDCLRRVPLLTGMISFLIIATCFHNGIAYADSTPGGNVSDPVVRAVDIARPAIVRIITSISGRLDVQFPSGQTVTFPQNGQTYNEQLSGTGTFITSNGDILTADHVVSPPAQELQDAAAQDIATYISQHPNTGIQAASATQVDQALTAGQLKSTAHYTQKSSEAFLTTDYTGPLTATTLSAVPSNIHATVDKIEKESAPDQMDVAIVHAPFQDTPSVQLGNSSNVQVQDSLRIIGFPGNGDVNDLPQNLFTSSVNDITVSSIKTTQTGAPLIQVGGNVEHGDSGGPAIDSQGNVVGIVSFGLSSATSPGSTNFLQASNSARSLITDLKLNTTPGSFQQQWNQAFTDYATNTAGHWHKAQQELQQIATSYPQFKAITPYLTYAQNQAKTENSSGASSSQATAVPSHASSTHSVTSWKSIALTVGAIALLVLLVIVLFFVAVRGRKKKAAPSGQSVPAPIQNTRSRNPVTPPALGPINTPMAAPGSSGQASPVPLMPAQPLVGNAPSRQNLANTSQDTLRPWPCGHMNRGNARFCSVCGEPAPQSSTLHGTGL